jgi:hypothetical protein
MKGRDGLIGGSSERISLDVDHMLSTRRGLPSLPPLRGEREQVAASGKPKYFTGPANVKRSNMTTTPW